MELHERLTAARPVAQTAGRDPHAELKNRVHLTVIGELGPQTLRERVLTDIRQHLIPETGLSRDDRDRLTAEIADDILGHGPLERLLMDDTITEIMVNGPGEVWIERQGRL